jgi:hypothetical protein
LGDAGVREGKREGKREKKRGKGERKRNKRKDIGVSLLHISFSFFPPLFPFPFAFS